MYLPTVRYKNRKITPIDIVFKGYNAKPVIEQGELSDCQNLSSKNFPCLSPRGSRYTNNTLTTANALFTVNGVLCWVDGTSFYYNGVSKGTVTSSSKSMVDFNGSILIFPDKKYYDYINNVFGDIEGNIFLELGSFDVVGSFVASESNMVTTYKIELNGGSSYTITNNKSITTATAYYYDVNGKFISSATLTFGTSFTKATNSVYMHLSIASTDLTATVTINNTVYPSMGRCPAMDYVTTHQNRVFGVKNNVLYVCALGDATDWTTFDGTDAQAGVTTISQVKEFTGIIAYQQHVVLFTKNETLELYGSNPPYTITDAFKKGCTNNKSVVEVNGRLFFLSQDGINVYGGGLPQLVSDNLNESLYSSAVAGTDGRKYYISLYNGSGYKLFVYDTFLDIWLKEDTLQVVDFCYLNNYLYALCASDKKVYKFNSGTETVASEIYTEKFTEIINQKKVYSKLIARVELETSASVAVYIKVDNGAFTLLNTYTTTGLRTIEINMMQKRCDHFQVKFVCSGEYKIYNLERRYTVSGDI